MVFALVLYRVSPVAPPAERTQSAACGNATVALGTVQAAAPLAARASTQLSSRPVCRLRPPVPTVSRSASACSQLSYRKALARSSPHTKRSVAGLGATRRSRSPCRPWPCTARSPARGLVLVAIGPAASRFLGAGDFGANRSLFVMFLILGITGSAQGAFTAGAAGPARCLPGFGSTARAHSRT